MIDVGSTLLDEPVGFGVAALEWDANVFAAALLFRVPPTDRALAGWDPGYWHLPEREG